MGAFGGGQFEDTGVRAVLKDAAKYAADAKRVQAANVGLGSSFDHVVTGSKRLQQQVGSAVSAFGKVTIAALGAAGIASIKFGADFEEQMSLIAGLTDTPREALKELERGILDVSRATAKSPEELGSAAYFILSSGVTDAATAMRILELSSKAAVSGLGQTQDIARTTTAIMNAYGLAVGDVDQVINTLVGTVRKGAADPATLAASLGFIIPLAAQMGVEFEQLGATLATLTNIGLDANNAVTALRGVLSQLLAPTQHTIELFEKLGLGTLADFREEIDQNFIGAMTRLFNVIGENDAVVAQLFPDIRGLIGALGAFGAQGANTERILHDLQTQTGFLDQAFTEASNTTNFKFRKALNDLRVTMTEFGSQVLPVVVQGLEDLQATMRFVAEHGKEVAVAVALIGVAFAWVNPAGAIALGLAALIGLITLLRTENEKLSVGMITVKLRFLETMLAAQQGAINAQNTLSFGLIPLLEKITGEEAFFARGQGRLREEIAATNRAIEQANRTELAAGVAAEIAALKTSGLVRVVDLSAQIHQRAAAAAWAAGRGFEAEGRAAAGAIPPVDALTAALFRAYQAGGILAAQLLAFQVQPVGAIGGLFGAIRAAGERLGTAPPGGGFILPPVDLGGSGADAADTFLQGLRDRIEDERGSLALLMRDLGEALAKAARRGLLDIGDIPAIISGNFAVLPTALRPVLAEIQQQAQAVVDAINRGVAEGAVKLGDVIDELMEASELVGGEGLTKVLLEALSAEADRAEEIDRIIKSTIERGTVRIQDALRLYELGAKDLALDFLNAIKGAFSDIQAQIDIAARALEALNVPSIIRSGLDELSRFFDTLVGNLQQGIQEALRASIEGATANIEIAELKIKEFDIADQAQREREQREQNIASNQEEADRQHQAHLDQIEAIQARIDHRRQEREDEIAGIEEKRDLEHELSLLAQVGVEAQLDALQEHQQEQRRKGLDLESRSRDLQQQIEQSDARVLPETLRRQAAEAQAALDAHDLEVKNLEDELERLKSLDETQAEGFQARIDQINALQDLEEEAAQAQIDSIQRVDETMQEFFDALIELEEQRRGAAEQELAHLQEHISALDDQNERRQLERDLMEARAVAADRTLKTEAEIAAEVNDLIRQIGDATQELTEMQHFLDDLIARFRAGTSATVIALLLRQRGFDELARLVFEAILAGGLPSAQHGAFIPAGETRMVLAHGPEAIVPLGRGMDTAPLVAALRGLQMPGGGFTNYGSQYFFPSNEETSPMRTMIGALTRR